MINIKFNEIVKDGSLNKLTESYNELENKINDAKDKIKVLRSSHDEYTSDKIDQLNDLIDIYKFDIKQIHTICEMIDDIKCKLGE